MCFTAIKSPIRHHFTYEHDADTFVASLTGPGYRNKYYQACRDLPVGEPRRTCFENGLGGLWVVVYDESARARTDNATC